MIFFSIGLPGRLAQLCEAIIEVLASTSGGSVGLVRDQPGPIETRALHRPGVGLVVLGEGDRPLGHRIAWGDAADGDLQQPREAIEQRNWKEASDEVTIVAETLDHLAAEIDRATNIVRRGNR